jgi:hypothetical protein
MKKGFAALRPLGFDKPTIWTKMNELAIKTQGANLGMGYPAWDPPQFYLNHLADAVKNSN